jgi:alkaline phosphatase D
LRGLKLNSQRAWSEYVPTRLAFDGSATHPFEALQIYRRFRFGELVELFLTDQQTYRSGHPWGAGAFGERYAMRDCDPRHAPDQTMPDDPQLDWFVSSVFASNALRKSWDNQVFLGELTLGHPGAEQIIVNAAAWDNFVSEREYSLQSIHSAGMRNFVALIQLFIASTGATQPSSSSDLAVNMSPTKSTGPSAT